MKDTSKGGAIILWIAWILTAISVSGPFVQFVILGIFRALGVIHLPPILEFPLGIYLFLLYGLAKPVCVLIAVWFAIVAAKSGIPPKTKLVTLTAMLLACASLLYLAGNELHKL